MMRRLVGIALLPLLGMAAQAQTAGNPEAGEGAFGQCAGCHRLEDRRSGVGPHLAGIVGRAAGSVDGFRYSEALAEDGRIWDEAGLVAFLTDPRGTVPGSRKTFVLRDEQVAADVVAYLSSLNE